MGTSSREKRAEKQRRRDERRGRTPDAGPSTPDRGLPPETLRRILLDTAADLTAGHGTALTELRHVLVEHLARRRPEVLDACDTVLREALAGADVPADLTAGGPTDSGPADTGMATAGLTDTGQTDTGPTDTGPTDATTGAADSLLAELRAQGAVEGVVPLWADRERFRAELVATATVTVLARLADASVVDLPTRP